MAGAITAPSPVAGATAPLRTVSYVAPADEVADEGDMPGNLDRRTYDLLRLIKAHEPIGSIRLVDLMQQRGYSIKSRTIRLELSELDEAGLTTKVSGRGRRLTETGRAELDRGDISGRRAWVRERIATLTSQVTYDPAEDAGELITGVATVPQAALGEAVDTLEMLDDTPLGPVLVRVEETPTGARLGFPSSITIDGILLERGINAELRTAGLVEYRATAADPIVRYIDAISGEESTMDVVSLLMEAGRTDVEGVLTEDEGVLIVDNREFPLTRYAEARDLTRDARERLGGVLDLRRPREAGPLPLGTPGWDFASLTYGGVAEAALPLLVEADLATEWNTLAGLAARNAFDRPAVERGRLGLDGR